MSAPFPRLPYREHKEFRRLWTANTSLDGMRWRFGMTSSQVYNYAKKHGMTTKRVYTGGLKA